MDRCLLGVRAAQVRLAAKPNPQCAKRLEKEAASCGRRRHRGMGLAQERMRVASAPLLGIVRAARGR